MYVCTDKTHNVMLEYNTFVSEMYRFSFIFDRIDTKIYLIKNLGWFNLKMIAHERE